MRRALFLIALAACGNERPRAPSASDALHTPVLQWKLTRDEWTALVVEPYKDAYDDYERLFHAALPALDKQVIESNLKFESSVMERPHYAGDPALTRGQARARWALPVQFPASVLMLDQRPLDAVFVRVGDRYKAIVGVDMIVLERTYALDPSCAVWLEELGTTSCQQVGWAIADAALRRDRARLTHACSLATSQCDRGKPSP